MPIPGFKSYVPPPPVPSVLNLMVNGEVPVLMIIVAGFTPPSLTLSVLASWKPAILSVVGPYNAVGINTTTGALGTFTPSASPVAVIKSQYNSYTAGTSVPFELTTTTDTILNTIGVTITDDTTNGDYITLPAAGIYKFDVNWSQTSSSTTSNGLWLNIFTQAVTGGAITSYDRIYVGATQATITQAYAASEVIQVAGPTRIYLKSEAQNAVTIRRAVITNPPIYTVNLIITKL